MICTKVFFRILRVKSIIREKFGTCGLCLSSRVVRQSKHGKWPDKENGPPNPTKSSPDDIPINVQYIYRPMLTVIR